MQINRSVIHKFIMISIGGIVNAFGITMFLMPVKLYDSGISGVSMLLSQLTPDYLTLSIFLLILNIPLFLYGLKVQRIYNISCLCSCGLFFSCFVDY